MNAAGISPDSSGFTDSAAARILSGYADAGSIPVGMRTTLAFALEKGYFAGKNGADGRLYLHPDEGISRAGSIMAVALEMGILEKRGSWFSFGDTQMRCRKNIFRSDD